MAGKWSGRSSDLPALLKPPWHSWCPSCACVHWVSVDLSHPLTGSSPRVRHVCFITLLSSQCLVKRRSPGGSPAGQRPPAPAEHSCLAADPKLFAWPWRLTPQLLGWWDLRLRKGCKTGTNTLPIFQHEPCPCPAPWLPPFLRAHLAGR